MKQAIDENLPGDFSSEKEKLMVSISLATSEQPSQAGDGQGSTRSISQPSLEAFKKLEQFKSENNHEMAKIFFA